jgi:hypothetical protein
VLPSLAFAQHDHSAMAAAERWVWSGQAQVFLNLNLQVRKFTDFHQLESQNWGMASVTRRFGKTRVSFHGMLSAEPWTLRRLGSAQVLQLGETLDGAPLLDYQHPHDLVMGLEARVDWTANSRTTFFVTGGPMGAAALGPPPFMHRVSSGANPTAPLSHHMLDSSHITHGVVTLGATRDGWTIDASVFRGREPDEDRVALDMGRLDSVSGRVAWHRGPWRAQVSSGHLNEPELSEPGDLTRTTASLEHDRADAVGRRTAWLAAWGRNDRSDHAETGWLMEGRRDLTILDTVYGRAGLVDRFILVDFDYAAATGLERHLRSWVAALTIGYERAVRARTHTTIAFGADVTLHQLSNNLQDSYGRPVSWHVFLRLALK